MLGTNLLRVIEGSGVERSRVRTVLVLPGIGSAEAARSRPGSSQTKKNLLEDVASSVARSSITGQFIVDHS